MGLSRLIGLGDADALGGKSLPVYMRDLEKSKRPTEAEKFIAEAVVEARVRAAQDQLDMLQKVQARLEHADGKRRDRLEEVEIQLYPKIGDSYE